VPIPGYVTTVRSNEIFSRMKPEEAERFLAEVHRLAPAVATLALNAAAGAFRLRPEFLRRQPRARQAEWVRRALGRRIGAPLAEEVLATYFLEHQRPLLVELLDVLGVEHEDGLLKHEKPPCPDAGKLEAGLETFRARASDEDRDRRELLLLAFASQSAVDWPELEKRLLGA
jgi:hypothetical protein